MTLPKELRNEMYQLLEISAERLLELLKLKSPDSIIGAEISLLYHRGKILFAESIAKQDQDRLETQLKQLYGYCEISDCMNEVGEDTTICAKCDAMLDDEPLEDLVEKVIQKQFDQATKELTQEAKEITEPKK